MAQTRPDSASRFPLQDRYGVSYGNPNQNPFDLRDTGFVRRTVEYDPLTKQYFIVEKIGNRNYRTPTTLTAKEFMRLKAIEDEREYFRKRSATLTDLNRRNAKPDFGFDPQWMNRVTGMGKFDSLNQKVKGLKDKASSAGFISIVPSGYVDIAMGYQGQNIKNPTLPERARKFGGFDFQMNSQLQVDAKIGDKITLPINYNTLANFNFENQLQLNYRGKSDELLKEFQAGNVTFASRSTLIPGAQSLFGLKSTLQFGKLYVSGVIANQRSQRQNAALQNGSASQLFTIKADEYEENRHFLMGQYFRRNYNRANAQLPNILSAVQIQRIEVWVTNRSGATIDIRDVVGLMDLGEGVPFGPFAGAGANALPDNNSNNLYRTLTSNPAARNSSEVTAALTGLGLQSVQDFEKTFARKLQPTEYYFQPRLGYLSLAQPLQPDEVLGVAIQYTFNGKVYQLGEFSQDIPPDSSGGSQKVLFLKLLKATSQRPQLPIWDLMMKNIYSLGFGQLERSDFRLDIVYEEPSLGEKRYLPLTSGIRDDLKGQPILTLTGLDRLNNNNDPQPDGVFDYLEERTVYSPQSRVIFPVLEPFGRDLEYVFPSDASRQKYLFYPLYDTIKAIAQTYAHLNRYELTGRSKSATNSDYQLGFNIPRGSVNVTAGGQVLQEGIDYEVNYDLGTVRVINPAIISSGTQVNISYENNATFGLQQRNFMGLRLDYLASKKLSIGGTIARLSERPFFTKQLYNEDPIRNTIYGIDMDYRGEVPRLTKLLNKLPFYSTKAPSSLSVYNEFALLQPGHAKQIGQGDGGVVYIDDFEGARNAIDLRFPLTAWTLASTPQRAPDAAGNILFPEAQSSNTLAYGQNRGKIAWYNIEPVLQERRNNNNPLAGNLDELSRPETRQVLQREIFPQRTQDFGQFLLTTFDLAYYPREKGPYNFRTTGIDAANRITQPRNTWGGLMRNIDQTDFETANIEFVEMWVQDPFINKPASAGGQLYLQLGNISEDILRDGKRLYENGLPTPSQPTIPVSESVWGKQPRNPLQVTNAFSNEPDDRTAQDVGYDGLQDTAEQRQFAPVLAQLQSVLSPTAFAQVQADPAGDNFKAFRDGSFTAADGILARYKNINGPHGNSQVATGNSQFQNAFTLYPDAEELNRDNTLNESEEYFQYRINLKPNMQVGENFITDKRVVPVRPVNGQGRNETWYLFRVPVRQYQDKVGNIPDFKSIRFIRMFLTGFEDTAVVRFAKMELVRNQWRLFTNEIDTTGQTIPTSTASGTTVNVLAVNLEENDQRLPIPYRQSPGIERQQQISNNNVQLLQNEQSLSLKVCNLFLNNSRGVFRTMNLDMRQYGRLNMFVHAEDARPGSGNTIQDGDIAAVVRIGNDFSQNYYEIQIPLKISPWGVRDSLSIWPLENNLDFDLEELTKLKTRRNRSSTPTSQYYSETMADGKKYAMVGNPNLGEVRGMLLAVKNVKQEDVCTEVWFNELRLSQLDEAGGWAAVSRVDLRLADLGGITFAGSARRRGFGSLEQRVNERLREDIYQADLSANLELGKLLPKSLGLQIPVYATYSKLHATPEYDPYDLDIKLREKLRDADKDKRDSIRNDAADQLTIKTIAFTNVKKLKTNNKPVRPWDISNLDFNFSHTAQQRINPIIELEEYKRTRAGVGYTYTPPQRFIEPLKRLIKSRSKWLALIRDFNFNYRPAVSVKADLNRQMGILRNRNVGGDGFKLPEQYDKFFRFDRFYTLRWDLTRSLNLDFNATNNARIDEPFGRIDNDAKKDSVKRNLFRGGRTTHYRHVAALNYTLPTAKIPLLDWTVLRGTYTAQYDWVAASLLTRNLGNTWLNGQTRDLNGDFNFEQLYTKSRFFREVYSDAKVTRVPRRLEKKDTVKGKEVTVKVRNPAFKPVLGSASKGIFRILTSVKRIGVQYREDLSTLLPGYLDSTQVLGMNLRSRAPGWKYVFGYQPDTAEISGFGKRGLLTRDSLFNELIRQRYKQDLNITAQISPIRDLNIDLTLKKTFEKDYQELQKDTGNGSFGISRLSPYATGSFSISYVSYQTLWDKFDPNEVSATFKKFEANRAILSQRLGKANPYTAGATPNADGYIPGYERFAQDVIIPSFIAAYTDKDPNDVSFLKSSNPKTRSNPFSGLKPMPNWNLTYNGLSRIKGLEKIFNNVSIRHGYQSTLSMNQFNTALLFQDPLRVGFPSFVDTTGSGDRFFVPYFLVPNVTITEAFQPLIEVDMTFTNELNLRLEYKKSRTLSLSLIDYQLAENRSTEYTVGFNWRRRNFPLLRNVKIGRNAKPLDNDVTFRFDFSMRDDATSNSKLDQNTAFGTAGQKVIRINPTIDYVVNSRINVQLYFEQNRSIPKIATSAPITTTRGGARVRVSLAP